MAREVKLLMSVPIFQLWTHFYTLRWSSLGFFPCISVSWMLWISVETLVLGWVFRGLFMVIVAMATASLLFTCSSHLLVFCLWPLERSTSARGSQGKRGSHHTQGKQYLHNPEESIWQDVPYLFSHKLGSAVSGTCQWFGRKDANGKKMGKWKVLVTAR